MHVCYPVNIGEWSAGVAVGKAGKHSSLVVCFNFTLLTRDRSTDRISKGFSTLLCSEPAVSSVDIVPGKYLEKCKQLEKGREKAF
jgi:hypothetical protein